jgi:hypothetical protein
MSDAVPYVRRRAIVIDAPCAAVFPWLKQMGFDRGGWYAIDRLERLFGVGRFATGGSARRIVPELQGLDVGDRLCAGPTRRATASPRARPAWGRSSSGASCRSRPCWCCPPARHSAACSCAAHGRCSTSDTA